MVRQGSLGFWESISEVLELLLYISVTLLSCYYPAMNDWRSVMMMRNVQFKSKRAVLKI